MNQEGIWESEMKHLQGVVLCIRSRSSGTDEAVSAAQRGISFILYKQLVIRLMV